VAVGGYKKKKKMALKAFALDALSLMALAQDAAKRQSGDAATRWPITILFSNGSAIRKQDGDWPPCCHVTALPLCRVLYARAIRLAL